MKDKLIYLFPVILALAFFLIGFLAQSKSQAEPIITENFKWGVQLSNFPLNLPDEKFQPERINKEMELLKKLGVSFFRFNLEFVNNTAANSADITISNEVNDVIVNLATKHSLNPVVIIEAGSRFEEGTLEDSYQLAYKRGYQIASRYKNKIKYYQLLNEVTGMVAWKENDSGSSFLDNKFGFKFNKDRYERTKVWLRGLSDGIHRADKDAKRLITGHWMLYPIIDNLIKDGVQFEILGWTWSCSDGNDITKKEINYGREQINLAGELAKSKKELWIVESNRNGGSFDPEENKGEEKQAECINEILKNIYFSGYFKGYFIFPFLDTPYEVNSDPAWQNYGLVKINKDSEGIYQYAEPKKAFWIYHDFINSHP